jgi:uncharacterized protein
MDQQISNDNNQNPLKIWVKLFGINDKKYCYDVGTNHIMQINDVLYDVLSIYDYSNKQEVLRRFSSQYPKKDILESFATVEDFNKNKGGFILAKKVRLNFPFNREQYRFLLDNFLGHMVLNITEDCNLRCKYCVYGNTYEYARNHNEATMSWEMIRKAVDFFISKSQLRLKEPDKRIALGFYGGEPLLEHKKIFKTVEYIENTYPEAFTKIDFRLTTNGTAFTEKIVKMLIRYRFKLLISLDGPKDMHDRNRVYKNGSGTYNKVAKGLELIERIDPVYSEKEVSFSTVMTPEYNIPRMIDYFTREHPIKSSYIFVYASPHDTSYFDEFDMNSEKEKLTRQTQKLLMRYLQNRVKGENDLILSCFLRDESLEIHNRRLFDLPDTTYPNGCCALGVKRFFVDVGGKFHACEKIGEHFNIGDLENGFDTEKIFDLVDKYAESSDHCEHCWAIRFCSACFITSVKNDEFSKERKKTSCDNFRNSLLPRLQTYVYLMEQNPEIFNEPYKRGVDEVVELLEFLDKYNFS